MLVSGGDRSNTLFPQFEVAGVRAIGCEVGVRSVKSAS
jgi:hypothetical protein